MLSRLVLRSLGQRISPKMNLSCKMWSTVNARHVTQRPYSLSVISQTFINRGFQPRSKLFENLQIAESFSADTMGSFMAGSIEEIEESQLDKTYRNSVMLVGTVIGKNELKRLATGRTVCSLTLNFSPKPNEDMVMAVEAWEGLAEQINSSINVGDRIHLIGRLRQDKWEWEGQKRQKLKVICDEIKRVTGGPPAYDRSQDFVASSVPSESRGGGERRYQPQGGGSGGVSKNYSELWMDVFSSPENWIDYRERKATGQISNPRYPDFKSKAGDDALWIDSRTTPSWVVEELDKRPTSMDGNPPF
jgi:single-strand DNA-binding protein